MGAFQNASILLGRPVLEAAQEYGYSDSNLLLLAGQDMKLCRDYPAVSENIQTCAHCADDRTLMDYARDLTASWVVEDWFLRLLMDAGCEISAAGADRSRELLSGCQVGATSDFQVQYQGKNLRVEFLCDYTGFWRRTGMIDLRDGKYQHLRKEQALAFGADALWQRGILLDMSEDIPGIIRVPSYKPYGGKPAVRVPCQEEEFFALEANRLAERFQAKFLAASA